MNRFRPGWILFPILGSLLAYGFRPSETDWVSFKPPETVSIPRKNIPLPDGTVMRFLGVPDQEGHIQFWLGERELSSAEARALGINDAGRGISAAVSWTEARAICERLSELSGYSARLPTLEEWRTAARGGISRAEVPWGFGLENAPRNLHFARKRAPRKAGPRLGVVSEIWLAACGNGRKRAGSSAVPGPSGTLKPCRFLFRSLCRTAIGMPMSVCGYCWRRNAIDKAFRENGVEIPFPQRDLHLRSSNVKLSGG